MNQLIKSHVTSFAQFCTGKYLPFFAQTSLLHCSVCTVNNPLVIAREGIENERFVIVGAYWGLLLGIIIVFIREVYNK